MTPNLTDAGKNLLLRALAGDTITFTNIRIGNGPAQDAEQAVGLVNPLLTAQFSKITIEEDYVTLVAAFTNSAVENGFRVTEIGFYAQAPDNTEKEVLYALGTVDESAADYVPDNASRVLEMEIDALIYIGEAENVAAAINSSLVYASAAELKAHVENTRNPHSVTKAQVGLENVPNVSTNGQTPTYTEARVFETLSSGEKMSIAFGKIKLAITNLINHIANKNNPHGVTANQAGAAPKSHTHSATDVNAGVLPVNRGGTGVGSYADLGGKLYQIGIYQGDDAEAQTIELGFEPSAVLIRSMYYNEQAFAIRGANLKTTFYGSDTEWDSNNCILGIVSNGFKVNQNSENGINLNTSALRYMYIAFK